jgi:hypothetical protein
MPAGYGTSEKMAVIMNFLGWRIELLWRARSLALYSLCRSFAKTMQKQQAVVKFLLTQ